jgi:DNA gyrase subunit A
MLTNKGRAYSKKVWEVPQAGRTAKGKAFVNLIPLQEGERVVALLPVREFSEGAFVVMATRLGQIKKTSLDAFGNIRVSGHHRADASPTTTIWSRAHHRGRVRTSCSARATAGRIRFREENVRPMGRTARGVRGIRLRRANRRADQVVGMAVIPREEPATLLTVCEKGYGKRTPTSDYPTKNRGGKGVITIKTTERNGKVVSLRLVTDDDDLMLITDGGKLIRMPVAGIPTIGRNTQGVRLIRLKEAEKVVADGAHRREGRRRARRCRPRSPRRARSSRRSRWARRIWGTRRRRKRETRTAKRTRTTTRTRTGGARAASQGRTTSGWRPTQGRAPALGGALRARAEDLPRPA